MTNVPLTTVNEYALSTWNFVLPLDKHARALSVRVQDGRSYMYVLEPQSGLKQPREFVVCSTGAYSNTDLSNMQYIGSFKEAEGHPVRHVFDTTPVEVLTPMEQLAACAP